MKKNLKVSLILLICIGMLFLGSFSKVLAEATVLKVGHVFMTDHPVHEGYKFAKEQIVERTNGRYDLQIYPAGSYSGYDDAVRAVTMGQLDIAPLDTAMEYWPESGVMLSPYTFRNYDHWTSFKKSDVSEYMKDTIGKKMGVKPLNWYQFGFRNATANEPLITPEDWQKIQLRVVDFAPYPQAATVLNANPVTMPIEDVYMALQTGAAEAQENPFTQILTMNFYEVQDYLMITQHMLATSSTIMAQQTWNSLSGEDQRIIEEIFIETGNYIDELVIEKEDELLNQLKDLGMEVIKVDQQPFIDRVPLVFENHPEFKELYYKIQEIE